MSGEHYFTAAPVSDAALRMVHVVLRGAPVDVVTSGGVFSATALDPGTTVLLRHAPTPPASGALLDLGCGWGPIALALALASPDADVWAVDVNERALELTRMNAASIGATRVNPVAPSAVPDDLRFRAIWSNPPIRIGKSALHELLRTWLPRLEPGGEAWLVVAKHLGGDSLQRWLAETFDECIVERAATDKGFRVVRVRRRG